MSDLQSSPVIISNECTINLYKKLLQVTMSEVNLGDLSSKMFAEQSQSEEYIEKTKKSHPFQNIIFGEGAQKKTNLNLSQQFRQEPQFNRESSASNNLGSSSILKPDSPPNQLSNARSSKSAKKSDNYERSRHSRNSSSQQFQKNPSRNFGNDSISFDIKGSHKSGSLFGSSASSKSEVGQHKELDENMVNYQKLLTEHYNDQYLMNFRTSIQPKWRGSVGGNRGTSFLRRSDIPIYITREPIFFQKNIEKPKPSSNLSGSFLGRVIGNCIYFKNINLQELENNTSENCRKIKIDESESISPSIQICSKTERLFYYSNTTFEIVILSVKTNHHNHEEICRVKSKKHRRNPLLYLLELNQKTILMVVGGYNLIRNQDEAEGSRWVEFYQMDKWGSYANHPKCLKLLHGRIYPLIIFPVKVEQIESIILLGGHSNAKRQSNGDLSFREHTIINESSNIRGAYISSKLILECLTSNAEFMTLPKTNNLSVQIEEKMNLYNGHVDIQSGRKKEYIRILLPKMKQLFTIKAFKKQVRVIRINDTSQRNIEVQPSLNYYQLELKSFRKKNNLQYFQINEKGFFQPKPIKLVSQNIGYNEPQKFRSKLCPCSKCEFM